MGAPRTHTEDTAHQTPVRLRSGQAVRYPESLALAQGEELASSSPQQFQLAVPIYWRGNGVGRGRGVGEGLGVGVGVGVAFVGVGLGADCTSKEPTSMRPLTTAIKTRAALVVERRRSKVRVACIDGRTAGQQRMCEGWSTVIL